MSFTQIDNYLSYQLQNNELKIRITDKYFSPYSIIVSVLDILSQNKIGDERAWKKLREDMYNTSKEVKKSSIAFPLELRFILKEEEFIIF